MQILCNIVK